MKRIATLIAAFVISLSCTGQTRTFFTLSDTAFTVGSIYSACNIIYDIDGHSRVREESWPCLDSLADFMKKHPELIFEIGSYTDQRGTDSTNLKLSQGRAGRVEEYLINHGVKQNSLAAVGYGEQNPIVPQSKIDAVKDKNEKENLYAQNRRTEFKILYNYPSTFTLTDSVFLTGAVLRLPLLFDLAKCTLRPEAFLLLDSLAAILITHPALTIEIANHTDTRVSDKSSMKISQCRAKSINDYLVMKGVSQLQLQYKGYEGTRPLIPDAQIKRTVMKSGQEELHQLNRRTEFRILSTGQ